MAPCWTFLSLCFSFIVIKGKEEEEEEGKKKFTARLCAASRCLQNAGNKRAAGGLVPSCSRADISESLSLRLGFSAGFWFAPTPTVQLTFTLRTTFIPTSKPAIHTPDLSGTHAAVTAGGPIRPHLDLFWHAFDVCGAFLMFWEQEMLSIPLSRCTHFTLSKYFGQK